MDSISIGYKALGFGKVMAISEYARDDEEISKKISIHYNDKRYEIGTLEKTYKDASDAIIFNSSYILFYNTGIFSQKGMFINHVYDLKEMRYLPKNCNNEHEIYNYLNDSLLNGEASEEFLLPRRETIEHQYNITKKLLYKYDKK